MNEEQKNTGNLLVFFLIVAIIIIIVMGFFMYKIYTDKQTTQTNNVQEQAENIINNAESIISKSENSISKAENNISKSENNNSTDSVSLELGEYTLNEVDNSDPTLPNNEGCGVTLKENNVCTIYEGYGNSRIGVYTIKDNKLICNTVISRGEEGPLTYTENDVIFEFNIINNNKLELSKIENNAKDVVNKNSPYDKNGQAIYDPYGLKIGMTYSKSN